MRKLLNLSSISNEFFLLQLFDKSRNSTAGTAHDPTPGLARPTCSDHSLSLTHICTHTHTHTSSFWEKDSEKKKNETASLLIFIDIHN